MRLTLADVGRRGADGGAPAQGTGRAVFLQENGERLLRVYLFFAACKRDASNALKPKIHPREEEGSPGDIIMVRRGSGCEETAAAA